jgi:hypothetical protein
MKNITLSAQEDTIEQARKVAIRKGTTLNDLFRNWLSSIGNETVEHKQAELEKLWAKTSYVRAGKKFSREEMNER